MGFCTGHEVIHSYYSVPYNTYTMEYRERKRVMSRRNCFLLQLLYNRPRMASNYGNCDEQSKGITYTHIHTNYRYRPTFSLLLPRSTAPRASPKMQLIETNYSASSWVSENDLLRTLRYGLKRSPLQYAPYLANNMCISYMQLRSNINTASFCCFNDNIIWLFMTTKCAQHMVTVK